MQNQEKLNKEIQKEVKPKSFLNRFWWVFVIIIVIFSSACAVIVVGDINHKKDAVKDAQMMAEKEQAERKRAEEEKNMREGRKPPMTADEVAKAEKALTTGIAIDDTQNDYVKISPGTIQPDGRPDNPNPWSIPFTDLKKVQAGADETYLYVKYQFYGIIPNETYRNGDDFISSMMINIDLKNFLNHNTGKVDESGLYQVGLTFVGKNSKESDNNDIGQVFNPPKLETSTFGEANSAVKDENNEDTYGIATGEGKTFGGVGYDYILVAFPLNNLGLAYGDTISFGMVCETGSKVFHHQSGDVILDFGSAKSGRVINWKIGTNSYTSTIPRD